ncbi:MAG: MotA/TolQ/ExbB proton channel family protein [Opitutales bacterium]|nr:MotA/TolQ/ExbB proton channel family protein [Opitutales bacterium]
MTWDRFTDETITILSDGGWLMFPLVLIALLIYGTAFRLFFYFSQHPFYRTKRRNWTGWVESPDSSPEEIRGILEYTQEDMSSMRSIHSRFNEVRNDYLAFPDSMQRFLMTLITAAPLMGLLGTVTGMLTTFAGLGATRSGNTVDLIAQGISEALITTQTGLIIAIPGYVIAWAIHKRRNEMNECLNALESMTSQLFTKQQSATAQSA